MKISQLRDQPEERLVKVLELPACTLKLGQHADEDEDKDDDSNDE